MKAILILVVMATVAMVVSSAEEVTDIGKNVGVAPVLQKVDGVQQQLAVHDEREARSGGGRRRWGGYGGWGGWGGWGGYGYYPYGGYYGGYYPYYGGYYGGYWGK